MLFESEYPIYLTKTRTDTVIVSNDMFYHPMYYK